MGVSVNLQHLPPFLLVLTLHGAALGYALTPSDTSQPVPIKPAPMMSGMLVSPPVVTTPKPRQKPQEQPAAKPKSRPKSAKPPLPKGPASERAVQAKPTVPVAPAVKTSKPSTSTQAKPAAPMPKLQLPSTEATGLRNQAPGYPKLSRKRKEQGTVLLLLLVDRHGKVAKIEIKQSSGFDRLDQAALQAVKQWQFSPAKQDGKAIDYWYEMPMNFSLNPSN